MFGPSLPAAGRTSNIERRMNRTVRVCGHVVSGLRCSVFRVQLCSHDARYPGTVKIVYPAHPLCGRDVRVTREYEGPPGCWEVAVGQARQLIPKWMTDELFCRRLTYGTDPRSCLGALRELRAFLGSLTIEGTTVSLSCPVDQPGTGEFDAASPASVPTGPFRTPTAEFRPSARGGETSTGRPSCHLAGRHDASASGLESGEGWPC